jgi:hypothetical protein
MFEIRSAKLALVAALSAGLFMGAPVAADEWIYELYAKPDKDGGGGGGGKPDNGGGGGGGGGGKGGGKPAPDPEPEPDPDPGVPNYEVTLTNPGVFYGWMHGDVQAAWDLGYAGAGATITVVDDYSSGSLGQGDLDMNGTFEIGHHGQFTSTMAKMVAYEATVIADDVFSNTGVPLTLADGFNVINASYGVIDPIDATVVMTAQEQSIVDYGHSGAALITKSAGNSGIPIDQADANGNFDHLGAALIGGQSVIFVGAISFNSDAADWWEPWLEAYSNHPGDNLTLQSQFLTVGVEAGDHYLLGTSFAAPIVAGYAAILSSKFTTATPTQVANQLLDTAREDVFGVAYDPYYHGQGEASLSLALSPASIN